MATLREVEEYWSVDDLQAAGVILDAKLKAETKARR